MSSVPTIDLNNGVSVPQLGFGVFLVPPGETEPAVTSALAAGYRHIDTARIYDNEREVGAAIATSGIPRDELFVTTKLWNADQGRDATLAAIDGSLERLGLDHVDLYLIHWPVPSADRYVQTWRALEEIAADGRARAIGVSNFQVPHLRRLLDETGTVPAVNQVELHPNLVQRELRAFHAEHGIATEAWSPLARGGLLDDPAVGKIAAAHGRTPAQVILRWHLQLGNVVIPKSVTPARIAENLDVLGFELAADDMAAIEALDSGTRIGPDPDDFTGS
ncbi:aldo/keto reductase [Pseudonocardia sp.]|uniref:aldo/keto reductase n=1 Tax=Pseudonocardia sp. TaxID=60912 RepID=UPI0026227E6D|nr:aldo/keto reductase [Pseudonocardia sp.]